MTTPELDISKLLLAAKEAGASGVHIAPDGSIDVLFDDAPRPAKRPAKRPRNVGGVHAVKGFSGGDIVTYWYAYRGGPRISEDEARRIMAAARNKVVPFTKPVP